MNVDVPKLLKELGIRAERRGREWWAKCPHPWHSTDSKASWSIADGGERNGLHNCFGCGSSGNAIDLVMNVLELSSYLSAISWILARGLNIDNPGLQDVVLSIRKPRSCVDEISEPRRLIMDFDMWPSAAKEYVRVRGITRGQIDRWGIATAVDGEIAGRIWIPVRDSEGRLLDWTARTWCDDHLTHKCPINGGSLKAVFGELYWPELSTRKEFRLVICEGAFDALACERAGASYIASLGGVTKYDRWRVAKFIGWNKIVIAVDPDAAGDRVSELIGFLSRKANSEEVVRLDLPNGLDCDDLWREDSSQLITLLSKC